jgi:hypothetical protein
VKLELFSCFWLRGQQYVWCGREIFLLKIHGLGQVAERRGEGESTSMSAIAGATVEHDEGGKGGNGAEKAGAGYRGRIFLWIMMGKDGRQGSRRRWAD